MIIGEIGINHNGDLQTALDLIDVAADCGIEVVKFQKRTPRVCVPESQWRKIEFGKEEYDAIDEHCREVGIDWTASVWDKEALDFIMQYDVPFIKVASATITDYSLLYDICDYNIPVVMSTGMSNEKEIKTAAYMLEDNLAAILYCKSIYPTEDEDVQLAGIYRLQEMFPHVEIGYSGHEIGYLPSLMARMLGVGIFERHITLDCNMWGTDHQMSLDPRMLKDFTNELARIDVIMGMPFKEKMR